MQCALIIASSTISSQKAVWNHYSVAKEILSIIKINDRLGSIQTSSCWPVQSVECPVPAGVFIDGDKDRQPLNVEKVIRGGILSY